MARENNKARKQFSLEYSRPGIVIYPVDRAIQRLNNWGKTSNVKATVKRGRET